MKHLTVSNFLGVKNAKLELAERNLIVGPNGSGKSSVQNAIRYAFCGDAVRVTLKKDTKLLISDGAKNASIDLDGSQVHITPAKVMYAGVVLAEMIPAWMLDMHSFTSAGTDERSAMLNDISGALNGDALTAAAQSAGLCLEKFATVLPLVAASLADAEEAAAKEARSKKGEWKGITGETWGADKAIVWQPVVDPEAAAKMSAVDAKIAEADEELVATLTAINDEERTVAPLRAATEGIEQLEQEYADAQEEVRRCELVIKQYDEELIEGNPFEELCGSLAVVSKAMEYGAVGCPHCNGDILALPADVGNPGLVKWADAEKAVALHKKALSDYAQASKEVNEAILKAGRIMHNLSKVRGAKARLDEVLKDRAPDFNLANAKNKAAELKTRKNDLYVRKQELMRACGLAEQAAELVSRAADAHKDIEAWLGIAEFFSATGAAAKLLCGVKDRLAAELRSASDMTGWELVEIDADLGLTYGGRDLRLVSESERWRADAMIAAAMVKASDRDVPILLDRIDVLDLEGRGQLIEWVRQSAGQWLLFGTLKAAPNLEGFKSYWIENGIAG